MAASATSSEEERVKLLESALSKAVAATMQEPRADPVRWLANYLLESAPSAPPAVLPPGGAGSPSFGYTFVRNERERFTGRHHAAEAAEGMGGGVLSLIKTFDTFDGDRSGNIDVNELRGALTEMGLDANSMQAMALLKAYDSYPDGGEFHRVDYSRASCACTLRLPLPPALACRSLRSPLIALAAPCARRSLRSPLPARLCI